MLSLNYANVNPRRAGTARRLEPHSKLKGTLEALIEPETRALVEAEEELDMVELLVIFELAPMVLFVELVRAEPRSMPMAEQAFTLQP